MEERGGHLLVHTLALGSAGGCDDVNPAPLAANDCVLGYSGTQGKPIGPNSGGRSANNTNPAPHLTIYFTHFININYRER